MANFNFYLNRQGVRGKQGEKGDKGDQGYSPYIEIKSDTPTEFIMTIHNENESFDTPNLIPQSIGEKVTELDVRLTTAESTIVDHTAELETLNTNYSTLNRDLTDTDSRVTDLNTKYISLQSNVSNINSEVNDLSSGKQNKLVEGENITLTDNADGTTTISSTGSGSGSGDVTAAGNNTFTGSNTFEQSIRINNSTDPYLSTFINSNGIGIQNTNSGEITVRNNMTPVPLKITASKLTLSTNNTNEVDILTSDSLEAGDNVTLNKNITTGVITISAAAGSSSLDEFISGSTNDNTTTISVKDGKALKLDAPTVIVGDNLVNTTDPEQMQLFLKQNDVAQGDNIVVDKTATGVKISTTDTVTTNTNQSISGIKTFNNGKLKIGEDSSSQIEFKASRSGNALINRVIVNRIEPYAGNSSGVLIKGAARNSGFNPSGYTGDIVDNTDPQYYLADNDIIAGDGIAISKTIDTTNRYSKITISSTSVATPENVVTTNTDQTITGNKTFKNPTGTSFTGTSSNSNAIIIDGDDKTIRFGSLNTADAVIKNTGHTDSKLKIGENFERVQITTNLYDKSGNLISGGGGSTPTNMVTTDTVQDITAYKTFSGGLQTTTLSASNGVRTSANINLLQDISGGSSSTTASIQPVMTDGLMGINLKTGKSESPDETGNYKKGKVTYNGNELLTKADTKLIAHQAMPSKRYIDITLGASGATYTAPADGYISLTAVCNEKTNKYMELINVSGGYRVIGWTQGDTSVSIELFLPVRENQTFRTSNNGTFTANHFRFYYAEGIPSA